jgi:RNA polymerase-associated protein
MMQLYSGTTCPYSHRCRIVLFEKGMDFEVIDVDLLNRSEDLAVINPYNEVPVMVERDLILYEANIINEYVDERFPHPQLMPSCVVVRACSCTVSSKSCTAKSISSSKMARRPTKHVRRYATT